MTSQLAYCIGLLLAGGLLAISTIAAHSLLSDLWKFFFLQELRSRLKALSTIVGVATIPPMFLYLTAFRSSGLDVAIFLCLAIVPALAWYGLGWWAWLHDDPATRRAAWDIAVERAERYREPPPRIDQKMPWKDYVFDVETAQRRLKYEPPPI